MTITVSEPLAPKLVQHLLEDLLAFGVAVLNNTQDGAPERRVVSFTQPVDVICDQITVYPGTVISFPDFQRSDKPQIGLSPKIKLWLRWTRCMTTPEANEEMDPQIIADDAVRLTEDAYRMVVAYADAKKDNTLFERYSVKQVQHVQFLGVEAIPVAGGAAGYQLALEVQLSGFAVRA